MFKRFEIANWDYFLHILTERKIIFLHILTERKIVYWKLGSA